MTSTNNKLTRPAEAAQTSPPHIRWLIRRDMEGVLEIEQLGFDDPWMKSDFVACVRQRNFRRMVIEDGRDVLGFMIYELHQSRITLLNLAVHPCCRRRGLGKQMIEQLKEKLTTQRRRELRTVVQEKNLDGHLFFHAMGFRAVAVVPGFFEDYRDLKAVTGYEFVWGLGDRGRGLGIREAQAETDGEMEGGGK